MAYVIKGSSKRGQELLSRSLVWQGVELFDVYGHVSKAKHDAWTWCKAQCDEMDGFNFHICSHNSHQFSVAWNYYDELGRYMTRIETRDHTYIVDETRKEVA